MKHQEIIAREGWIFIGFFAVLSGLLYYFFGMIGSLPAILLTVFSIFFFRNPPRTVPGERGMLVSPADGRVMDVVKVYEDNYLHGESVRVRIFLSIFNVHINRIPIRCSIDWVKRASGLYLPAYKDEAGTKNARNYIGFTTDWGKMLVVQVTGIVARRLVCWVEPGDVLETGERFGLIRFGSCTEIYLPPEAEIMVQEGQKVKGGETIIARFY